MLYFVLDDEPEILEEEKEIVAQVHPDADIMTFSRAKQAIDAMTEQELIPDAVFLDIEMPGLTGLEFAARIRTLSPATRVIFVTGYPQYALDAFRVKAQGYLLKPLTAEAVREELSYLPVRYEPGKLEVRCFGHFEVFWEGKPLMFQRKKSKELLTFLIDREGCTCTADEIIQALWEYEGNINASKQWVRNIISDLRNTLKTIGFEELLQREHRQIAIRRDMVDCDYYRMLAGDVSALNAFRGQYMIDYSWAELTSGKLYFRQWEIPNSKC